MGKLTRDWPGGKYWAGPHVKCETCGAHGYLRPKYAPPYCGPCWDERVRDAEWQLAKWESEMAAEYGPHIPKKSSWAAALSSPEGSEIMSYEVFGDNDDDYASVSDLIDNGWWDEDTVQRVKDAVQALRTETIYENGRKEDGIGVRFIMRLSVLSAEVGLMEADDPMVIEARAALARAQETSPALAQKDQDNG